MQILLALKRADRALTVDELLAYLKDVEGGAWTRTRLKKF